MSRLVIVSNRVPSLRSKENAGGLAVVLQAALEESGGLWFGWNGQVKVSPDPEPTLERSSLFSLATVDFSRREFKGYYEEFSNRTLWPLFHGRLDLCRPDSQAYEIYRQVNRRFARGLHTLLRPEDMIWIHDYHLIPLGRELRRLGVTAPIGFFLHIPFPQTGDLAALPPHRELLSSLGAYDLVGFQTPACVANFQGAVVRYLGGAIRQDGTVVTDGRVVNAKVFPVGIDTSAFKEMANSPDARRWRDHLQACMRGREWVCGVERLDYTKGIAERFRTFETLLESAPELHNRVSLVQIAAPSRQSVAEYQEIQSQLESMSGRINGRFGTFGWTPIRYLNRTFGQEQLAALYRVSRVGLVTPLRDGMNLVAKEYVAAQDPEDPGVLILSRFAGAAQELTDAVIVNPHDTGAVAQSLRDALEMPLAERKARWERMMRHLERHDIDRWRRSFVDHLATASCSSRTLAEAS
jgi:trehalose 6-phosphate synthase